jgi:hypothetical protein
MLSQPFIVQTKNITKKIKSCSLTVTDIKKMYSALREKANEAAVEDLQEIQKNIDQNNAIQRIKVQANKLWVEIWGSDGDYFAGDDISIFDDMRLPEKITCIKFTSAKVYTASTNRNPKNTFEVQFDFRKARLTDFSRPLNPDATNNSYINIQGINDTWVNGVYQKISNMLNDRKTNRNWIHTSFAYEIMLYTIFLPMNFRIVYLIGQKFRLFALQNPLQIGAYIYLFIGFLFIFRIFLFNYPRWVYPLIELKYSEANSIKHQAMLAAIFLALISTTIYEYVSQLMKWLL